MNKARTSDEVDSLCDRLGKVSILRSVPVQVRAGDRVRFGHVVIKRSADYDYIKRLEDGDVSFDEMNDRVGLQVCEVILFSISAISLCIVDYLMYVVVVAVFLVHSLYDEEGLEVGGCSERQGGGVGWE